MAQPKKYKIATIGSHSALQILKGAKDEGFETICICLKGKEQPYKSYNVADKIILIDNYDNFEEIEDELIKENAIIIPHASFIAYMGIERVEKLSLKAKEILTQLGYTNVKLKVGDVRGLKVGECLTIREQKTGKKNVLMVNKGVYTILQKYLM